MRRGLPRPPRSPPWVPPPAEKGAVLGLHCAGPGRGRRALGRPPALAIPASGAPAARGRGSPVAGGHRTTADAGAPTCTASLAMSSRRPPGVPALAEGRLEERACAQHGAWRAGRGRARWAPGPARGPLRPAPLRPRLARPPRPHAAPSGPSGRRTRHVTVEVGARGGGGARGGSPGGPRGCGVPPARRPPSVTTSTSSAACVLWLRTILKGTPFKRAGTRKE